MEYVWNMHGCMRPIETLFLCHATVSWNTRVDFAPLRLFAATCRTQNRIPKPALEGQMGLDLSRTYHEIHGWACSKLLRTWRGPILDGPDLIFRSTVSQKVHVDFAPLRPFESLLFCCATVSWNMRIDFAPLRPFETLFLCRATVSWNMRVNFAPLRRFAASRRTHIRIPKRP